MMFEGLKYLVVGAGFYGAVIAERIANDLGEKVLVVDKRKHIAGNCYSNPESSTGIECHEYGSHIFHTSDERVWNYIKGFTTFNSYIHTVLTKSSGCVFQIPINLATINSYYSKSFNPSEARKFLKSKISDENIKNPKNFEEKAISLIGRDLYSAFIKGYTLKQWETNPTNLPAETISRLPVRYNYNNRYFSDRYEGIPTNGYTHLFENLLRQNNITISLGVDFFNIREKIPNDCQIIYSGPIDKYFDYKYGQLGWRTVRFEKEILDIDDFQGTSVMNYANENCAFTRIHEFKHFHPEREAQRGTVIYKEFSEFPTKNSEPYYPINTLKDQKIYQKYLSEAAKEKNVHFGGRLGAYKYWDMDKCIAKALGAYETTIKHNGI